MSGILASGFLVEMGVDGREALVYVAEQFRQPIGGGVLYRYLIDIRSISSRLSTYLQGFCTPAPQYLKRPLFTVSWKVFLD